LPLPTLPINACVMLTDDLPILTLALSVYIIFALFIVLETCIFKHKTQFIETLHTVPK